MSLFKIIVLRYFCLITLDIDLRDTKYECSEKDGFKALFTGLVVFKAEDGRRMVVEGFRVFENL
jgi:hypothetical protein